MTPFTAEDRRWMRRALALARRGWGWTAPNPMVGAVLVRGGAVVGEGWHTRYGAPHAEREALGAAGDAARGATLYVTLEPCNHIGLTPPCVPALLEAGVARVVYATRDPNPVARGGASVLAAAGVRVEAGLGEDEARELNAAFHHRFASTRPFVTLKLAVSLDCAITDSGRTRGWLTGPAARREVHRLRAGHDAIAVGSGTVLADDPRLTVRGVRRPRVAPVRVVFDRRGRTPATASVVVTAHETATVVLTSDPVPASLDVVGVRGCTLVPAPTLEAAFAALKARGVSSLLCEGGATLAGSLLTAGAVDRLVIFRAPVLLGAGALPAFGAVPGVALDAARRLRVVEQRWFGDDEMTVYALT